MSEVKKESFSLPYAADLPRINEVVTILFSNRAHEKYISGDDLNKWTGININTISGNMKFLRTVGLVTADSRTSSIKLTEDGKEYGEALNFADKEKEKKILKKLCETNLYDIKQFCEMRKKSGNLQYDDVFKQLARITNTVKIDSNNKKGIEAVIEMLVKSGILEEKFLPQKNSAELPKPIHQNKKTNKNQPKPNTPKLSNIGNNAQHTTNVQPQFQNITQERLGIDIKINIDAKDKESFDNTLNFLRNVTSISKRGNINLDISKELKSN